MINNILPTPKHVELFDEKTVISPVISCCHTPWIPYIETLQNAFSKIYEADLTHGEGGITLAYDAALPSKSYRYEVQNSITLTASDDEGIMYALATLLQAISVTGGVIEAEKALIEDYPDKDYRTLMVDLAREWHPAHSIFKYIDICFFLKVKYLHLHFIDDQRYTLPSQAFPHITDGNRFYSYEQIAAMRSYANQRGIVLVPEFEAPGHAAALNRNYPEVFAPNLEGDTDTEIVTEAGAVITAHNIVCAGRENTMSGIRTLLAEICELFPETPYIHIGGDEANIKVWNYCADSSAYMKENGIEDV
jgi:hexosaminidase